MSGGGLRLAVEERLAELAPLLRTHAGGLALAGVSAGGEVSLRFTGMCCGCPFRPLTAAATIRPALLAVPGVTAVTIPGTRISAEAEERLAAALGRAPLPAPGARRDTPPGATAGVAR